MNERKKKNRSVFPVGLKVFFFSFFAQLVDWPPNSLLKPKLHRHHQSNQHNNHNSNQFKFLGYCPQFLRPHAFRTDLIWQKRFIPSSSWKFSTFPCGHIFKWRWQQQRQWRLHQRRPRESKFCSFSFSFSFHVYTSKTVELLRLRYCNYCLIYMK